MTKNIRDVLTISRPQGFVEHMPVEEYEAVPAIRMSHVVYMDEKDGSPLQFHQAYMGEREDKEAWIWGRAAHVAVFEPRDFAARVWESDGKRTPAKKEEARAARAELLKPGMVEYGYGVAALAAERIAALLELRPFVQEGQAELSGFTEEFGMQCKFRLDWIGTQPLILDLKSTRAIGNHSMSRDFYKWHYNVKLGCYQRWAAKQLNCNPSDIPVYIIVLENRPPCDCFLWPRYGGRPVPVDQPILDRGAQIGLRWIERIRECIDSDEWPGMAGVVDDMPIETPAWEMDDEDNEPEILLDD